MKAYKNAIGAILIQLCLGGVLGWSLWNQPMVSTFGFSSSQFVFTVGLLFFYFAFGNLWSTWQMKTLGVNRILFIGVGLFTLGTILSGFMKSLPLIYLTLGMMSGFGLGCLQGVIAVGLQREEHVYRRPALIMAMAVGIGAMLFKFIIEQLVLINVDRPNRGLIYLGVIYFILTAIGSWMMKDGFTVEHTHQERSYSVHDMVKTPTFYLMWLMFFLGCIPTLLFVGFAYDMGVALFKLDTNVSADSILIIGFAYVLGSLFSRLIADLYSARMVIVTSFIIMMGAVLLMLFGTNTLMFQLSAGGLMVALASLLAVMPIQTSLFYGRKHLHKNYSVLFLAFGIAGMVGPVLKSLMAFETILYIALLASFIGMILSLVIRKPQFYTLRKQQKSIS